MKMTERTKADLKEIEILRRIINKFERDIIRIRKACLCEDYTLNTRESFKHDEVLTRYCVVCGRQSNPSKQEEVKYWTEYFDDDEYSATKQQRKKMLEMVLKEGGHLHDSWKEVYED